MKSSIAAGVLVGGWLSLPAATAFAGPADGPKTAPAASAAPAKPAPGVMVGGPGIARPGVAASTKTAVEVPAHTVDDLYKAGKMRDPFSPQEGGGGGGAPSPGAAGGAAGAAGSTNGLVPPEEFSIHSLTLKGVMEGREGGFAVFSDPRFAATFVLKGGRLYDGKSKPVKGVSGRIRVKQKEATLMTPDKDVQVFTLGESEEGL